MVMLWRERSASGDILWRHMGHCPLADSCLIHCVMQCLWKLWPHFPDTGESFSRLGRRERGGWRLEAGRLTEFTVIPGKSTRRTGTIKMDLADSTDIVFWDVPAPGRHR